ncbi:MAG: hypothetical protein NT062_05265 [Proteobacteria bacterium]|nr:hypothetical protein [Pseudomonadota bacterium]
MRVELWPISVATTNSDSRAWTSQLANVRRRSLQVTRGIPARVHAAARSRVTLPHGSTTGPTQPARAPNVSSHGRSSAAIAITRETVLPRGTRIRSLARSMWSSHVIASISPRRGLANAISMQ